MAPRAAGDIVLRACVLHGPCHEVRITEEASRHMVIVGPTDPLDAAPDLAPIGLGRMMAAPFLVTDVPVRGELVKPEVGDAAPGDKQKQGDDPHGHTQVPGNPSHCATEIFTVYGFAEGLLRTYLSSRNCSSIALISSIRMKAS